MTTIASEKAVWVEKRIGDVCNVGDGAHAKIKRQDSGVKYLTSKNFKDGGLDLSKVDYIAEEDFNKHFREHSKALTSPASDDVVFSIIGSIGEPYLVRSQDQFGISSSVAILRPDKFVLLPKYLYYWVKGHIFQDALYGIKGGVAQGYVSLEMIKSLPLRLPSLFTQHKIASVLSAYDDLIENNNRRIQILEEMAQRIYQEWFVRFRFPGHEKAKMVESEIGPIPKGWFVKRLRELAEVNKRSIKRRDAPAHINYIDISSVSTGQTNNVEQLIFADAPSRARRIVQHGDIIWSTVRPNRKSYSMILNPPPDLIVSTGFAVVSATDTPYTYLYYALTTDDFAEYLTNRATGSAYPAVNAGDFEDARVILPPKPLLDSFHQIVTDLLDQQHNLRQRNSNLRCTRDLLLPKLISGEVDVEDMDVKVPE